MFKKLVFILFIFSNYAKAQEIVSPLPFNPVIKSFQKSHPKQISNKVLNDTIQLPFFDDFSYEQIYPSNQLWMDSLVFINNSFGKDAISKGVATFDGYNANGDPYFTTGISFGICDTLTSKPINLAFPASDSLYFSFYVQPQGKGRAPAIKDSLILEFKNINTNKWVQIKRFAGSTSKDFKMFMIPIKDTTYLKKGFQFRFKNKGSQFGGDDHWNIDYVKLERFASYLDTVTFDVSITGNPSSLLKSYSAVPYNQFNSSLLAENHFVSIRNNFDQTKSTSFTYRSYIKGTNTKIDSATRGFDLPSTSTTDSISSNKINIPQQNHPFVLKTTYFCSTGGDLVKVNDTVNNYQVFGDYFAYDDGTAENGYGLTPSSDGRFAYKFNAINSDTLRAVSFFFTQKELDNSNNLFTLTVWKSINPEVILYQKTSLSPMHEDGINDFVNYDLDSNIIVQGDFYVGWIQSTNFLMNIGLDRNYINNDQMFYKVTSQGWQQSTILGSVMIRPVFSDEIKGLGIEQDKVNQNFAKAYPNPGSGLVNIKFNEANLNHHFNINVYDLFGRKFKSNWLNNQLDFTELNSGLYIIQIIDENTAAMQSIRYLKK